MKESNSSDISMKYYNFFAKVYLIIVIFFNSIITFMNLQYAQEGNIWTLITIAINIILYIIFPIQLKDEMILKTKKGYKMIIIFLVFDFIYRIIISTISIYLIDSTSNLSMYSIIYLIIYSIWYVPNLVYFIKRKEIFINEKKKFNNKNNEVTDIIQKKTIKNDKVDIEIVDVESNQIVKEDITKAKKNNTKVWKILIVILIIFTITMVIGGIIHIINLNETTEKLLNEIENLEKENKEIEQRNVKYIKENLSTQIKANFFDKYVLIVPKNTRVYHKYDCQYCDISGATLIFINDTQGYKPCSHCIK